MVRTATTTQWAESEVFPEADAPRSSVARLTDAPGAGRPRGTQIGDPDLFEVATSFQEVRVRGAVEVEAWREAYPDHAAHANLFLDLHRSDPAAADRLAQAVTTMPEAGTEFLGFQLTAELGRGALGRVFVARQPALANRQVVLKVSPDIAGEAQALAQLQHTNVVPLYSVHRAGPFQAVCMPYFGAATLADVLRDMRGREALPESGRGLISTLIDRHSTVQPGDAEEVAAPEEPAPAATAIPQPGRSMAVLEMLQRLSYVQAVLWLGARLADGLAHAHERGILHRDLKPANVLLTDEGQPMLLDFNLAHDTKLGASAAAAQIGGTLPFMGPEQLRAYQAQSCTLNFNGDIYSLGVILFELLTGRHPFPTRCGPINTVLGAMIQDRQGSPPPLRPWNPAVSPAVESIVRHCLEPDPARRYQSARHLQEDLDRQLKNLPLRHAAEPSLVERARKWARRHPRLSSSTTAAAVAAVLVAGLVGLLAWRGHRLAQLEAKDALARFRDEKQFAQFVLTARSNDSVQLGRGVEACRAALGPYRVLEDPDWRDAPAVRLLSAEDRDRLCADVGEMLVLMARAVALRTRHQTGPERDEGLFFALKLNELAEPCQGPSRALCSQRADLLGQLGREEEARKYREQVNGLPPRTVTDRYLSAVEHVTAGRVGEALPLLKGATAQAPQDFQVWFLLAVCHDGLSQFADAAACYSTCVALVPTSSWAYFNRGLAWMRLKDFRSALADFDQAIRLRPDVADAYVNRANARRNLADFAGAIDDLTKALDLGAPAVNALLLRAVVRERAGDADGAKLDRAEGLRREPDDELGWLARGYARLAADPAAALADFDEALRLNPLSLTAMQNKSNALGRLGRTDEAIEVLNREVELYPDFVNGRSGRAILLARLGRRAEAHRDAEECRLRDSQPITNYQLADVYALTSRTHPEDRRQAFRLLALALERGVGFDMLDRDTDLDPVRQTPEFRELVAAARVVHASATAIKTKP